MIKPTSLLKSTFIIGTFLTATSAKNYEYKPVPYKPYQAENGSYRGEMNTKTYRPKTEYVRPYKHKDGSRVRSHYRNKRR
jgi:hypothetical protein